MSNISQGRSQEKKNSEYLEAAEEGELETLVTLLDAGADINCKDEDGNSALHLAAEEDHDEIVKTLVDRGLDVNTRGENGWTPLMHAATEGNESLVNFLIEAGADITCRILGGDNALHLAAFWGHDTIVQMLVDRGLDVNSCGRDDMTPLMYALMGAGGQESIANFLIKAGADVTCKDEDGNNVLHLAAMTGHDTIVKMLEVTLILTLNC